ncbi:CD9 antigen isoform X1 [Phycodurus eques]|uniref:CD9 antigen isoform X1 n=1 Tax=Phycodurus eques TaxID=693459 RepID=UPI002ACD2CCD|nr:CD9 antigen isoform X1 [Phycodurus eques]XP_061556800.1 CD9 antigen isoform X1 [Phycodurus eques]XP_061556801.1 CD9 antigen isoform X1 [Phycodurus eques]
MALDGCGLVCKYILLLFNLIFAVLGFALLGLGLWLRFSDNTRPIFEINALNSSTFVLGVILLIALGTVMLVVVTVGDYGACSEKKYALQVFSVLLFILAVAETVVGVLAYTWREEVGMRVVEFYTSIYTLFAVSGDAGIGVTLMFIHKMLHCCGVTGVTLLEAVSQTCPEPKSFFENIAMPTCPGVITDFFNSNAPMVMGIFIGTGALLIIALICSMILNQKLHVSSSSPQYIMLTNAAPSLPNVSQHGHVSSLNPDQEPALFTPLTEGNITVVQT